MYAIRSYYVFMSRDVWQKYYQEVKNRKHLPRTEVAVRLNQSGLHVAVDCGCGTGSDIEFLAQNNYRVYGSYNFV